MTFPSYLIFDIKQRQKHVAAALGSRQFHCHAASARPSCPVLLNPLLSICPISKVLKGHDDHVITCLQFCGNRIVSGSDDNTLKVWSAITGKVRWRLAWMTRGWAGQRLGEIH